MRIFFFQEPVKQVMEEKPKKPINNYAKFTSLGIQMGVIIGGSVWLGTFLDGKYNPNGQAWTISLSLFGVAAALYQVMKEVINMSKDDDKK